VVYLIEQGSNINKENVDGETPLFYACRNGNKKFNVIKYLIEHGADINKKNRMGETPIVISYKNNNKNLFEYLREHGAEFNSMMKISSNISTFLNKVLLKFQ